MFKNNYRVSPNHNTSPLLAGSTPSMFSKNSSHQNLPGNPRKAMKSNVQNIDLECDEVLEMPPPNMKDDDLICN